MPNATGSGEGWLADWFQAHRPQLRARRVRREDYVGTRLPEPVVAWEERGDPAQEAALADTVGLALLVVLETLTPAERLAFVLHDIFAVPFGDIAEIVGRAPAAARRLASRARRHARRWWVPARWRRRSPPVVAGLRGWRGR